MLFHYVKKKKEEEEGKKCCGIRNTVKVAKDTDRKIFEY
jgi:hypothetical protein